MKIDLLYLWVDGNDPEWRAKKDAALVAAGGAPAGAANHAARFQDNEELKYSLRSVERFAPWINHIFIITDGQRPDWLRNDPRVSIVDHTEIIPKELLPTFSSNTIELFLHKVPGLSEHFLFANDDFFFGRPVSPDFFFTQDGKPIVIVEDYARPRAVFAKGGAALRKGEDLNMKMQSNAQKYAFDKTGIRFHCRFKHAFEPMRKSYLAENIESDREMWIATTAGTFRRESAIMRLAYPLLDFGRGRNVLVRKYSRRNGARIAFDPKENPAIARAVMAVGGVLGLRKSIIDSRRRGIIRQLRKQEPEAFCLNYIGARGEKYRARAMSFLSEMFPKKSRYEK